MITLNTRTKVICSTVSMVVAYTAAPGTWAASNLLEEVVVTAQKREQSLQDVSVAVTAVSGNRISDGLFNNIEDLQALVPSVSVGSDFAQAKLFVRGIGLSSSFAGVDPSVALHVDGAIVSQSYAQLGSFFDLERIEILRGPQGTLYGRNATGGSFNLITKKPTNEVEGYGRFTVGDYDLFLLEGALSGPISDNTAGRIAVRSESRSGYGENEVSGDDIDDANKQAMRGHLRWDINDHADLLLSGEWAKENDSALALKFIRESFPDNPELAPPGVGGFAKDKRDVASEASYRNDRETWSVTGTLNWRLNEQFTLKSITNYRDLDLLIKQDLDISSNINDDVQNNVVESEHFSEELQIIYDSDRLHGLFALFYFQEDLYNANNIGFDNEFINTGGFPLFPNTQAVLFTGDIDIEAAAAFANFSYELTDTVTLKLGGRYSYESRDAKTSNKLDFSHFGPAATNRTLYFEDDKDFTDFSPTLGVEWRPTIDTMFYGTYSQAFKSGTIQGGQLTPILDPEEIENFELGVKGTFLDGNLRTNISAFYYEIEDLQLDRTFANEEGGFSSVFENAAETEGKGIEVEAAWRAADNFTLSGYVGYMDIEFVDYEAANNLSPVAETEDLAGNRPRQAPEWSWNIRGDYDFPLDNGGLITVGAEASYKDEQFYTEFNDEITSEGEYTLVNANVRYSSPEDNFFVNVWGKNLTDEEVYSGIFIIATGRTIGGSLLPPRTYGVTIGYDF
ncbi:TonB-dependent receptor [Seongchinamella sediminis]|uniref:TonB-dependent receptor n=1 Tax=Seongchinamella sediminis TaxID=2283635 RepID=A0A3L7DXL6_9GAMM|nr:TonB-dependent receptor [Seongchinamella sediminis]RLQ21455.1 TonB-dependent receptor [Seongchinamella sediminis]